jgi:RNA-directed DNA polymerase
MPGWTFGPEQGRCLCRHDRTKIVRHVKVQGNKSPLDGDWVYWASRQGHYPGVSQWLAMLLKRQGGKCVGCGLSFMPEDLLEVHHQDGKHTNYQRGNLAVLHRHCHDTVHGRGRLEPRRSVRDKDCSCEEPYECESLTYGSEDQPGGRPPG